MPFASLHNRDIFFEDTACQDSDTDKPAIVFSHGLLMDRTMFRDQIAALSGTWRCITWDASGHGQTASPKGINGFDVWDAAKGLAALLQHLEIEQAVLAGASQGGAVSLRCALMNPGLSRGLVLMASQAGPMHKADSAHALADFWISAGPTEQVVNNAEHVLLGRGYAGATEWREKWWRTSAPHFLECLNALGEREDLAGRLHEIDVPSLVIHGAQDIAVPVARGRALAQGLRADWLEIEGAGHAANLTHPIPVNQALLSFLGTLH